MSRSVANDETSDQRVRHEASPRSDGMEDYISEAAASPPNMTVNSGPIETIFAPIIRKLQSLQLPYRTHAYVGFGKKCVLVGDNDNKKLVKYSTDQDLHQEWSKDLPEGVRDSAHTTMTSLSIVCSNGVSHPTLTFNHNLETRHSYQGNFQVLLGSVPYERLVYVNDVSAYKFSIEIYQLPQHVLVGTLTRPGEPYKSYNVSLCYHKETNWLAVVSGHPHKLDIYDSTYNHVIGVNLPFEPGKDAMVAIRDWIFIEAPRRHIHVYNWNGVELRKHSSVELGLGDEKIYGVGGAVDDKFVIAAGRDRIVKTLNLYSVQW